MNPSYEEDGRPVPAVEFDYDQFDSGLFEKTDMAQFTPEDVDRAIAALRVLLSWVWQNGMKNSDGLKIRAIIICWVFLQELRPMKETEVARGFGLKKQSLGRWVTEFKKAFPIRLPHMRTF